MPGSTPQERDDRFATRAAYDFADQLRRRRNDASHTAPTYGFEDREEAEGVPVAYFRDGASGDGDVAPWVPPSWAWEPRRSIVRWRRSHPGRRRVAHVRQDVVEVMAVLVGLRCSTDASESGHDPMMRRGSPLVFSLALAGCGGAVNGLPSEAGSDPRDATSDTIATGDSTYTTLPNLVGDAGGPPDATLPPLPGSGPGPDGLDNPPVDAGPDMYDGALPLGPCGPSTCLHGCCTDVGQCVDPPTAAACGWFGAACVTCEDGGICVGAPACVYTLSTCGPATCGGCCIGNTCNPGTIGEVCGSGGSDCKICEPGSTCRPFLFDAGGFCQTNNGCDPSNCTGCCIGGICAQGDQVVACGIGGVACKDCGDGGACQEGTCTCGPPFFTTCP